MSDFIRKHWKKIKKRCCSFIFAFSLFFACSFSSFAYSIPGDWFLPYSRLELRNGFRGETHPERNEFVELSDTRFVQMNNPAVTANGGMTWIVKNLSYDSTRDITFILTVRSWNETTLSNFSFYPESLVLGYTNHDLSTTWFTVDDVHFFHRDAYNSDQFFGYSVVFTVPADMSNSFSRISLSGSGTWPPLGVSLYAYYSDDASSSVTDLAAILSKLEDIEDSISNQNNFIISGNDATSGIISDFNDNLSDFNDTISEFDDFENQFIDDFTSANDDIKSSLSDYTFTGNLLSCANWVTDKYMDFYNVSGDFKQYFIYPLIIGIVLFFIGRGGVVIGNLYRKPYENTTVTHTESDSWRDINGRKYTVSTNKVYGRAGRWRKW